VRQLRRAGILLLIIVIMGILTPEKMDLKTYKIEMVALKPYEPPLPAENQDQNAQARRAPATAGRD